MQQFNIKNARVGYVVKRYPVYSETFIVNEILAHERAGLELELFALNSTTDGHFQDPISRVRTGVTYLPSGGQKMSEFWNILESASGVLPEVWSTLGAARGEKASDICQAVGLAREARLRGVTHLHAHFATSATTVARLAARFANIPFTFTAHAKDIFHESVRADDLVTKLREAATCVTVSDYNREHLRGLYGTWADRVIRIYNGLHLDQFPYKEPRERTRRIVAVGRLVEKKGFADLIEACAILADRKQRFSCMIIGVGVLESELTELIRLRGLQSFVELTGPRSQREIVELVQSASVVAAPCVVSEDGDRDGLPTVLLEAMALGTPCISTDVTGIPELVRNGKTGLMVQQRNPAMLADAIARLLASPALRVRLANGARKLIESDFDIHRNAALQRETFLNAALRKVA